MTTDNKTAPVDVLARKVFDEYSRAGGNLPDDHFDRNAAEQWMAHALEFAGVAELIEEATTVCQQPDPLDRHVRLRVMLARVKGEAA